MANKKFTVNQDLEMALMFYNAFPQATAKDKEKNFEDIVTIGIGASDCTSNSGVRLSTHQGQYVVEIKRLGMNVYITMRDVREKREIKTKRHSDDMPNIVKEIQFFFDSVSGKY